MNVVSDGDSKAMLHVQKTMPYGSGVVIVKFECVGHVKKRVGAFVINLTKNPPLEIVNVVVKNMYFLF